MKRILICGGRYFEDERLFNEAMDAIFLHGYFNHETLFGEMTVIHGDARGADTLAKRWAYNQGYKSDEYFAEWASFGKRAGYLRNKQMLEEGKPQLVIAFPGGKGTNIMIDLAVKARVLTLKVEIDGDNIMVNEVNSPTVELKTEKYRNLFIAKVQDLKFLTPGQRAAIFRDLIKEEQEWLDHMGSEYDEIMQVVDAMDKT